MNQRVYLISMGWRSNDPFMFLEWERQYITYQLITSIHISPVWSHTEEEPLELVNWENWFFKTHRHLYDHIPWVRSLYIIVTTPLNKSSLWALVRYGQSCDRHVCGCQGIQFSVKKEKKADIAGINAGARHCTGQSVCNISLVTLTVPQERCHCIDSDLSDFRSHMWARVSPYK